MTKNRTETAARSNRRLILKCRDLIYNEGYSVNNRAVEALLQSQSLVPTDVGSHSPQKIVYDVILLQNAFAPLLNVGFDIKEILCVDILHEFELGVWKAVLVHLIRMLHAIGSVSVSEMNER